MHLSSLNILADIKSTKEKNKIIEKAIKASKTEQLSEIELKNLDRIAITLEQIGNTTASKEVYHKIKE